MTGIDYNSYDDNVFLGGTQGGDGKDGGSSFNNNDSLSSFGGDDLISTFESHQIGVSDNSSGGGYRSTKWDTVAKDDGSHNYSYPRKKKTRAPAATSPVESSSSSMMGATFGNDQDNCNCFGVGGWNIMRSFGGNQPQHYNLQPQRQTQTADDRQLDSQLAQALSDMTVNERNTFYEECNGIVSVIEEDPKFVQAKIRQLDEELKKHAASSSVRQLAAAAAAATYDCNPLKAITAIPYQLALSKDSSFIHNYKFKLMFLRASRYDVARAVQGVLTHFEWKLYLFGEEMLVKNIRLEDLNEDDLYSLRKQTMLFLPGTDRAGRKVFIMQSVDSPPEAYKTWKNHFRSIFYQFMVLAENETYQKLGCAVVAYLVNQTLTFGTSHFQNYLQLPTFSACLPLHKAVFHCCYNSRAIGSAIGIIHKLATKEEKSRFKTHYGKCKTFRLTDRKKRKGIYHHCLTHCLPPLSVQHFVESPVLTCLHR